MVLVGEEVSVVWRGRRVRAFVPALLAGRDLVLDAPTVARTTAAAVGLAYSAAALPADYVPLARLLLRAEGIASSFIEGIRAPVVDVVLAEVRPSQGRQDHSAAAWVAANLAAGDAAVQHAAGGNGVLTVGDLCDWHGALMAGSPTPARYVGVLREEQGWIGGTSPLDAHLVTPPADRLAGLLADLLSYVNRTDVDPIAQAAVAHAQFELIHPFRDGNGRVGRILVAWVLTRRLALLTPPPVSTAIAADVGGYTAGLTLFRLGEHRPWIRWFADAVSGAGQAQQDLLAEVASLQARWRSRLSLSGTQALRRDAAAWALLELLPRQLVLTAGIVADALGITSKAAASALGSLAAAGILTLGGQLPASGRGRPAPVWVSEELLALAGASPLR